MSSSTFALVERQEVFLEEERRAARAISPLIDRFDDSVLWNVAKIFSAGHDKRVKRGGCVFLAYLLRFSTFVQRSLFPGTEVGDAARIAIPNILRICQNKENGWPWCYESTLKYLDLLVAAGILVKRPDEPGIYYLRSTYALRQEDAIERIEKLAKKRSKVSHSAAFKRTKDHCTKSCDGTSLDDLQMVDSPKGALVVDEQEVARLVQTLSAAIQRCQGVALLPSTLAEVMHIVATHAPSVLKKGAARFIARRSREATSLLSGDRRQPFDAGESTNWPENLPVGGQVVDSRRAALTDSLFTTSNDDSFREKILSESSTGESTNLAERSQIVDSHGTSAPLPHPLAQQCTPATMLSWRFPQTDQERERGTTIQSHLAALLSDRFEGNGSREAHYMKLLTEDCRALDIAIIDAMVRSHFPDPKHKRDTLGGAWVTNKYQEYRAGAQMPEEILAWADRPYTYDAINAVLAKVASFLPAQGRTRPRPGALIVDSSALEDFWTNGAAEGLRAHGYLYVDLDGDLLTCEEYEQRRLQALEIALDSGPPEPAVEAEVAAYLDWVAPAACDAGEEAMLLANLPSKLLPYLGKLERILDPERYVLSVQVAPLSRRRLITVHMRHDPGQAWLLPYGCDVDAFIKRYRGHNIFPCSFPR